MSAIASKITSLTIVYSTSSQAQGKENIKAPRHWPLWGNSPDTGEFPAEMASNAENVSIWWRHHVQKTHSVVAKLLCIVPLDKPQVFKKIMLPHRDKGNIDYLKASKVCSLFTANCSIEGCVKNSPETQLHHIELGIHHIGNSGLWKLLIINFCCWETYLYPQVSKRMIHINEITRLEVLTRFSQTHRGRVIHLYVNNLYHH